MHQNKPAAWLVACCLVALGGLSPARYSAAQALNPATSVSTGSARPAASAPILTLSGTFSKLDWNDLTPEQKVALQPLAGTWKDLSDPQKRKWISLCANYSRMSAPDQTRLHDRMLQWAGLSPKQRDQARLNFAQAQKITPQQKTKNWQAYQALSPEEKQKLAKIAQPTPPRTALAIKPVMDGRLHLGPVIKGAGPMTKPASGAASSLVKVLPTRPRSSDAPLSPASHE